MVVLVLYVEEAELPDVVCWIDEHSTKPGQAREINSTTKHNYGFILLISTSCKKNSTIYVYIY